MLSNWNSWACFSAHVTMASINAIFCPNICLVKRPHWGQKWHWVSLLILTKEKEIMKEHPDHLKEGQVGMAHVVKSDLGVHPRVVLLSALEPVQFRCWKPFVLMMAQRWKSGCYLQCKIAKGRNSKAVRNPTLSDWMFLSISFLLWNSNHCCHQIS